MGNMHTNAIIIIASSHPKFLIMRSLTHSRTATAVIASGRNTATEAMSSGALESPAMFATASSSPSIGPVLFEVYPDEIYRSRKARRSVVFR